MESPRVEVVKEAAQLAQTRNRCQSLATIAATAKRAKAARRARPRVDLGAIQRQAIADAPGLVDQLRSAARWEVELVFGARPALLYVQERIAATRAPTAARRGNA